MDRNELPDWRLHDLWKIRWSIKPWRSSFWKVSEDFAHIPSQSTDALRVFISSELYAVVEEMKDHVEDCIAVGQKLGDGDERVYVLDMTPINFLALNFLFFFLLRSHLSTVFSSSNPRVVY